MDELPTRPLSLVRRVIYSVLGTIFLILAVLGALLPIMPAAPFLLLASYFFARSIPSVHRYLLRHPLSGPILHDWEIRGGIRRRVRWLALAMIFVAALSTFWIYQENFIVLAVVGLLLTLGVVVVLRLPIVESADASPADPQLGAVFPRDFAAPPAYEQSTR